MTYLLRDTKGLSFGKFLFLVIVLLALVCGAFYGLYRYDQQHYTQAMNFLDEVALAEQDYYAQHQSYTTQFEDLHLPQINPANLHNQKDEYRDTWGTCRITVDKYAASATCTVPLWGTWHQVMYTVSWNWRGETNRTSCTVFPKESVRGKALCAYVTTKQYETNVSTLQVFKDIYTADIGVKYHEGNYTGYYWVAPHHTITRQERKSTL